MTVSPPPPASARLVNEPLVQLPPASHPDGTSALNGDAGAAVVPPTDTSFLERDVSGRSVEELCTAPEIYNRELSWLDFNWRVLHEAKDPRNPLVERLKFLGITGSNLDEFIRKRVGGLQRQRAAGVANLRLQGWTPEHQLDLIGKVIDNFRDQQDDCLLQDLLPKLADEGIRLLSYDDLSESQVGDLRNLFLQDLFPLLTPLAYDPGHPFPFISNLSLNLAVEVRDPRTGDVRLARLKAPTDRHRWIPVGPPNHFVSLVNVLLNNLDTLFRGMEVVDAYPFRITRNATLVRNEDEADDLVEMISDELQQRRFAPVVQLEVSDRMPRRVLGVLLREFGLHDQDVYRVKGVLDVAELFNLANLIERQDLKFPSFRPQIPSGFAALSPDTSPDDMFRLLSKGDRLLHHPYQSFARTTQEVILAATRDPKVLAIKHTMYRTSDDSAIVAALAAAAGAGKQVAVLVEVKARFDEELNIHHSKRLEEAGCHVAYGLVGLKTHSKVTLIVRQERDGLHSYAHIGTGNYNAKTASVYTDYSLLTTNEDIVSDVMHLFNYLTGYGQSLEYKHLLVAPINMRDRFIEMLEREIEHCERTGEGHVMAKVNGLDDPRLCEALYAASQAGVRIDLIVRGICRIRPGIPEVSENITVLSLVGRFLEHSRIFYFANDGEPECYIGSADWMQRNLDNRVEAIVPLLDPKLRDEVRDMLALCVHDQRNAWEMRSDGSYVQRLPAALAEDSPDSEANAVRGAQLTLMMQANQRSLY